MQLVEKVINLLKLNIMFEQQIQSLIELGFTRYEATEQVFFEAVSLVTN